MTTITKVSVFGTLKTVPYANIFHIKDDNDNAIPLSIATTFRDSFVVPISAFQTNLLQYNEIEVQSLTAANPYKFTLPLTQTGQIPTDALPTGVHINVFLGTDDFNERGGNKLIGGMVEANYTDGLPGPLTITGIGVVFNALRIAMGVIDVDLAVFRSVASLPGFPVAAAVTSSLVKGTSTNNRRNESFIA